MAHWTGAVPATASSGVATIEIPPPARAAPNAVIALALLTNWRLLKLWPGMQAEYRS
jgi:hypothetical protein